MDDDRVSFAHPAVNEPISAIGGEYLFTEERRVADPEGDLLVYKGFFMIDRSCCGVGGSAYAMVAGFVDQWHCRTGPDNRPVSLVRPVKDKGDRARIAAMIKKEDPLCQVSFL